MLGNFFRGKKKKLVTLLAERFFQKSVLACTKSFASLVYSSAVFFVEPVSFIRSVVTKRSYMKHAQILNAQIFQATIEHYFSFAKVKIYTRSQTKTVRKP